MSHHHWHGGVSPSPLGSLPDSLIGMSATRAHRQSGEAPMKQTAVSLAAAFMFAAVLQSAPAQALATRTFVAAQGSDTNPCTFAAPSRSFQVAYNVTAAGGEIDVL